MLESIHLWYEVRSWIYIVIKVSQFMFLVYPFYLIYLFIYSFPQLPFEEATTALPQYITSLMAKLHLCPLRLLSVEKLLGYNYLFSLCITVECQYRVEAFDVDILRE